MLPSDIYTPAEHSVLEPPITSPAIVPTAAQTLQRLSYSSSITLLHAQYCTKDYNGASTATLSHITRAKSCVVIDVSAC